MTKKSKKIKQVKCINGRISSLTKGKLYEVLKEMRITYTIVDDDGDKLQYDKRGFEPVVKEKFTPEPMTIEQIYKAFINKETVYDVGDDYLDEIDLSKYDYLKIARESITAESEGEVCLLVTDLKSTYKTHEDAYKVFASRREQ